jgi:hypothetical protein
MTLTWIAYSETEKFDESKDLGGMGGFFSDGMRWKDYIENDKEEYHPYLEAIRKSIVANEIWADGYWHQQGDHGVPLFDDGFFGCYSFRAWGDLLAAVWSEHYNEDYSYMSFYCSVPDKPIK